MEEYIISVPRYLIFESTIEFINSLEHINGIKKYVFDFQNLSLIDPISLLLLSSEIHLFKVKNAESEFSAKNYNHCSYAAHMGFFQAFGLKYGKFPGEATNNNRYIPIRIFSISDIKDAARDSMIHPAEILEDFAKEISSVLTQGKNEVLSDILRYSLREIFRNIVEHSKTDKFGFCAQYLPSLNKVSFAVLDRGIGVRKSLSENPKLVLKNDMEAIKESLLPGISGKVYPGQKSKPKGEWANSGYGLYMTSNICINGGSFFIGSGNKGLYITEKEEKELDVSIHGTALNLTMNLHQKNNLDEVLKKLRDMVSPKVKIKASKSSMDILSKPTKNTDFSKI